MVYLWRLRLRHWGRLARSGPDSKLILPGEIVNALHATPCCYHGSMPQLRPVDLLHTALQRCVESNQLLRRLEAGKLHEDMLLVAACEMARQVGVPARMVSLHSSTHPLELRNAGPWPDGYGYITQVFLEVDEELLRLALVYPSRGVPPQLIAQRFPDRHAALQVYENGPHHDWREAPAEDMGLVWQGMDELRQENDLTQLRVDLEAAQLQQATPQAMPRTHAGPRL